MPTFEIEYKGGTYEVEAATPEAAMKALGTVAVDHSEFSAPPDNLEHPMPTEAQERRRTAKAARRADTRPFWQQAAGTANQLAVGTLSMVPDALNKPLDYLAQKAGAEGPVIGSAHEAMSRGAEAIGGEMKPATSPLAKGAGTALGLVPATMMGGSALARTGTRMSGPQIARSETRSLTGAGTGSAIAEETAPGSPWADLAMTMGGALAPSVFGGGVRSAALADKDQYLSNLKLFEKAGIAPPTVGTVGGKAAQTTLRRGEAMLDSAVGSAGRQHKIAAKFNAKFGEALNRVTGGGVEKYRLGKIIERGVSSNANKGSYVNRFRVQARRRYDKFRAMIPDDLSVGFGMKYNAKQSPLGKFYAEYADEGSQLVSGRTPAAIKKDMENFALDLQSDRGITFQDLQKARTRVFAEMSDDVYKSADDVTLRNYYNALTDTMEDTLKNGVAAGSIKPGALKEWNNTRRWYARRMSIIEDMVENVGKKAKSRPEDVVRWALGGAKDGPTRLLKLKSVVNANEWDAVRRHVLHEMGVASPGKQLVPVLEQSKHMYSPSGTVFSVDQFVTRYSQLPDSTRKVLFGSGRYAQRAVGEFHDGVERLAQIASLAKERAGVMANPSGTTGTGMAVAQASATAGAAVGIMAGGGAPAFTALGAMAGSFAAMNMSSRLLSNQRFIQWLGRAPLADSAKMAAHMAKLPAVAQDDPIILEEIERFMENMPEIVDGN